MFESVTTITEMARSKIAMNSFSTIQTEKSGNFFKTPSIVLDRGDTGPEMGTSYLDRWNVFEKG